MKRRAHNIINIAPEKVVPCYINGESVLSIATRLGVSRGVINRIISENGTIIRNQSAAMFKRMEQTSSEERKRLVKAAHDAIRGTKRTDSTKRLAAISRERHPSEYHIGKGEIELRDELIKRGFTVFFQKAIDIFNIDILFNTIAVEVKFRTSTSRFRLIKRIPELAKRKLKLVVIDFRDDAAVNCCLDEVIALLECVDRKPSSASKYWVIRCGFQMNPGIRGNNVNKSLIVPSKELFCTMREHNISFT